MISKSNYNANKPSWYAIYTSFIYEGGTVKLLEMNGIEHFIPTRDKTFQCKGNKIVKCLPAIPGIIFIRTTRCELGRLINSSANIHIILSRDGSKAVPAIIPDSDMQQVVKLNESSRNQISYVSMHELDLRCAKKVRVSEGKFNGTEGLLTNVTGLRNKRVVITLGGITAAVLPVMKAEFIEDA